MKEGMSNVIRNYLCFWVSMDAVTQKNNKSRINEKIRTVCVRIFLVDLSQF